MFFLNLTAQRRERVVAALPDGGYKLAPLNSTVIRMSPELHMVELRHGELGRQGAAAYNGGKITGRKGGGKSREAMAAELESDEPEDFTLEADDQKDWTTCKRRARGARRQARRRHQRVSDRRRRNS